MESRRTQAEFLAMSPEAVCSILKLRAVQSEKNELTGDLDIEPSLFWLWTAEAGPSYVNCPARREISARQSANSFKLASSSICTPGVFDTIQKHDDQRSRKETY